MKLPETAEEYYTGIKENLLRILPETSWPKWKNLSDDQQEQWKAWFKKAFAL